MNSSRNLSYIFRSSPLFRALLLFIIIVVSVVTFFFVTRKSNTYPEIESITPPVGAPGDVVTITGKNFGDLRDMGYVEIAGSKLTASSYISWSDTEITIVLPANVQDGLVYVGTKNQRSKPSLFANEVGIPVPVITVRQVSKPVIKSLSASKFSVGDLLTIRGDNFGDSKGDSKVLFTIDYENKILNSDFKNINVLTENMLNASDDSYDFVSWSNSEIKLYVPEGIDTGVVIVDTGVEKSEPYHYTLNKNIGTKSYINKKNYVIEYTAEVDEIIAETGSTITFRFPLPAVTAYQPCFVVKEVEPIPVIKNYQKDMIQQIVAKDRIIGKKVFKQSFVLPVYEIRTNVHGDRVSNWVYKNSNPKLLAASRNADELIPADDESVKALSATIIGKEKNPYKKAKLIYDYMCKDFTIDDSDRNPDDNPLDLLESKTGDAYDFAIVYTALLRAAGVAAVTDGGVLVCNDMSTKPHWWVEFFIEDFGWIPADVALGAGLEYNSCIEDSETYNQKYYFGNLDSYHIAFSRGYNAAKPLSLDNKILKKNRFFALQSIWEEYNSTVTGYSSYWTTPVVKGIY